MRTKRERPTESAGGRLNQSDHNNQSAAWAHKRPPDPTRLDRNPEPRLSESDVILTPASEVSGGDGRTPAVYVDKFGRTHSDAVLQHWSPTALRALGIIPANNPAERGAPDRRRSTER
jgi:hypothetical protein